MNDQPTAEALLRAVEHFLESEIVPNTEGVRRFHARVAANVVAVVARELETEDAHACAEWKRLDGLIGPLDPLPPDRAGRRAAFAIRNASLVDRIDAGDADTGSWREAVLEHLRDTCAEKLAVSHPPRQRGEG